MHFWTWRTEEVRTFIRWMRSYNQGKPEDQMIRYMGNDCQFTDRNMAWLKDYFETNSEDLYQDLLDKEEEMNELLVRLVTRTSTDLETMNESFEELLEAMDDQKESLVSLDGEYRYHIARRLIQILSQVIRVKYVSVRTDIQENPRDQYMAENVEWIDDYFQNEEKIVIWAHNLHVQKPGYWWMGHHLNLVYGDDYQVVGFAFSMGEFTAKFINSYGIYSDTPETVSITIVPMPDTVNDLFYRAEKNNFHLNLDMIPANSPLGSWLNQSQEFLQIGAGFSGAPGLYYSDEKLKVYYDHMIYFEISHHTRQIPK
jgi:erythromycin esterase